MELMDKLFYSVFLQIIWIYMYSRLFPKRQKGRLASDVIQVIMLSIVQVILNYTLESIRLITVFLLLYIVSVFKNKDASKKALLVETTLVYEIAIAAMIVSSFPAYVICNMLLHTRIDIIITIVSGAFLPLICIWLCKALRKKEVENVGENRYEGILTTIILLVFVALGIHRLPFFNYNRQLQLRIYATVMLAFGIVLILQWFLHLRTIAENKRTEAEEKEQLAKIAREREEQFLDAKGDNHKLTKAIADTQERVRYLQKQLETMRDPAFMQAMSAELQTCLNTIEEVEQGVNEDIDRALYSDLEVQSGNSGVDEYLRLTARRMASLKIKFLCAVQEDAACLLVPSALSAYDLRQIIANLLENAARSVEESMSKERVITFSFGRSRGAVRLRVSDSGEYFEPQVLQNLGMKGNTTQGNGFGLVNILEALARCGASFSVEEFHPPKAIGYKKSITLLFDGAGMVSVVSPRDGTESYRLSIEKVLNRTTKIEESSYVPDR